MYASSFLTNDTHLKRAAANRSIFIVLDEIGFVRRHFPSAITGGGRQGMDYGDSVSYRLCMPDLEAGPRNPFYQEFLSNDSHQLLYSFNSCF